jgi:hypothetical protein
MLIKEFISIIEKDNMIATLMKYYKLENIKKLSVDK